MSNLPITSRIKRSPLLSQALDAINPDDPGTVTVGGVTQEPDTTETTTKTKNFSKEWDKKAAGGLTYAEWIKKPGNKEKEDAFVKSQQETVTTVKPGEKTVWEGTLKEKTTGDVMQPWEVRQMSRSIKKEQRDIRRAKEKMAKAEKRGNTAKYEEAKAEKDEFEAAAKRNKEARASGKKTGTADAATGQKDMLQSTLTKEEQKKFLEDKAKRDAAKKDITTSDAPTTMNPSAFKMYGKSPAAKKLQGAQNTLPQHLQDAIKAAPGKMKAPLKKGYFKK
jgi:hypothetical protein